MRTCAAIESHARILQEHLTSERIYVLTPEGWAVLVGMALLGLLGYLTMTMSLVLMCPVLVSTIRFLVVSFSSTFIWLVCIWFVHLFILRSLQVCPLMQISHAQVLTRTIHALTSWDSQNSWTDKTFVNKFNKMVQPSPSWCLSTTVILFFPNLRLIFH